MEGDITKIFKRKGVKRKRKGEEGLTLDKYSINI